jgi:CheY-like chemotaxis protein
MAEKTGKTVLVVDDEPDVRLFLQTVLEDAGFDVALAANGNEALDRMTERLPDVISLDLVMPKMSGLKFYKYIQKNKERACIPVIVVTAHAKDEFGKGDLDKIKRAKSENATMAVVEKPIQPDLYINAVRVAVGLDELPTEDVGEKDVLKVRLKEKMKSADKDTLKDVLKMLEKESGGGGK